MSEEISVPELSEAKKAEFAKVLNARKGKAAVQPPVEYKGKEEEVELKAPTDLMRKLAILSERKRAQAPHQVHVEMEPTSPSVFTMGAVVAAVAIAVYFGHKAWKAYGVVP